MPEPVVIPRRFNGPLDSGQGGYSAGVAARLVGGPAEVSLRRPVPLDTPLEAVAANHGSVKLVEGGETVVEARPIGEIDLEVPDPVTPEQARDAKGRYTGSDSGVFSRCFVCGRGREDSFGVFAGAVKGRSLVASPWIPVDWTADGGGNVRPEFVWAALDCPASFAAYVGETVDEFPAVLARLTADVLRPVPVGEEHVVMAWPIGVDGRKRHSGVAVVSAEGAVLAVGRALMIEPRREVP